jgi:hypothetical protein
MPAITNSSLPPMPAPFVSRRVERARAEHGEELPGHLDAPKEKPRWFRAGRSFAV